MPFDGDDRAFIAPKTEIGKLLLSGLTNLGPNGEHWTQGQLHTQCGQAHCALGSLMPGENNIGNTPEEFQKLYWGAAAILDTAAFSLTGNRFHGAVSFNDWTGHTFLDVRNLFLEAIRIAEAEA